MFTSKNFGLNELRCHCAKCNRKVEHNLQRSALDKLQELRELYGAPLSLSSSYRCSQHPSEKKKVKPGQHNAGTAFDIRVTDGAMAYNIMKLAFQLGFTGIALGEGFVHVDTRKSIPVSWRY